MQKVSLVLRIILLQGSSIQNDQEQNEVQSSKVLAVRFQVRGSSFEVQQVADCRISVGVGLYLLNCRNTFLGHQVEIYTYLTSWNKDIYQHKEIYIRIYIQIHQEDQIKRFTGSGTLQEALLKCLDKKKSLQNSYWMMINDSSPS